MYFEYATVTKWRVDQMLFESWRGGGGGGGGVWLACKRSEVNTYSLRSTVGFRNKVWCEDVKMFDSRIQSLAKFECNSSLE